MPVIRIPKDRNPAGCIAMNFLLFVFFGIYMLATSKGELTNILIGIVILAVTILVTIRYFSTQKVQTAMHSIPQSEGNMTLKPEDHQVWNIVEEMINSGTPIHLIINKLEKVSGNLQASSELVFMVMGDFLRVCHRCSFMYGANVKICPYCHDPLTPMTKQDFLNKAKKELGMK